MEEANFWESLTNSLVGAGGRYFEGKMVADTKISLTNITAAAIGNIVKFVAVVLVLGAIIRAIFGEKS